MVNIINEIQKLYQIDFDTSSSLEDINTKNHPKRKDDKMITIIKQELDIDESLKTKLSYICEFANTTPTFIKGNIRKLDKTNY